MSKPTTEQIERLYDKELSASKERALSEQLKSDNRELEKLNRLGDMIRLMSDETTKDVSFDGFSAQVLRKIKQEQKPSFTERLSTWFQEFFEHKRAVWVPSAALAAMAVAVFAFLPMFSNPTTHHAPYEQGEIWTASALKPSSTIDAVNFGDTTGMVFEVNLNQGGKASVVWIVDQ